MQGDEAADDSPHHRPLSARLLHGRAPKHDDSLDQPSANLTDDQYVRLQAYSQKLLPIESMLSLGSFFTFFSCSS